MTDTNKDLEEIEDKELKKCPFCGGTAWIRKSRISTASNRKGTLPPGAVVIDTWIDKQGRERVAWAKYGYTVHCQTRCCYCRAGVAKFPTREEAIERWNNRHNET